MILLHFHCSEIHFVGRISLFDLPGRIFPDWLFLTRSVSPGNVAQKEGHETSSTQRSS